MNTPIAKNLLRLFEKHRIIFWYDTKEELRAEFDALTLPQVEKIVLHNNEYSVKHRILRDEPKQQFLLYHTGPQPSDENNWLLDVLLAHGEFRTDQVGIWLAELQLGLEFSDIVQEHIGFFKAQKRLDALKVKLEERDTPSDMRRKMLSICAGSDSRVDAIVEQLLQEVARKQDTAYALMQRSGLTPFLWSQLGAWYDYASEEPNPQDFALTLFKSALARSLGQDAPLSADAEVFMQRWKDSRQHQASFEALSEEFSAVLDVKKSIASYDVKALLEMDDFRCIDRKIIHELALMVSQRTVSAGEVSQWIRQRKQSYWYAYYEHYYETIDYAARFITMLDAVQLEMSHMSEGIERYAEQWFKVDQYYRKTFFHAEKTEKEVLNALLVLVENLYANNFLRTLGDRFQEHVSQSAAWSAPLVCGQQKFFEQWVKPYTKKDRKLCVIISDALRYEIADELSAHIRNEDRYTATLEKCLSALPSYTQLGMAALLPHKELSIEENGTVLADGKSTVGTENRNAILEEKAHGKALTAESVFEKSRDEIREIVKSSSVLYVYHNHIDVVAENKETEVFNAVEKIMEDIVKLVKKLNSGNIYNFLITADHGFLYQQSPLEESDFTLERDFEGQAYKQNRRFVLGRDLTASTGLQKFTAQQLGLYGETEVLIPKSIHRLRRRGSGSRFVHGGASLQEVVVPVLKVNKSRTSDTTLVDVEFMRSGNTLITSGQLPVTLYQTTPVTEKVHERAVRIGLYTEEGVLISDSHELTFNFTSEQAREREISKTLTLSRLADTANGKDVFLRLEEKHGDTTHYKEYTSLKFTLRRTFTSDFDF